MKKTISMLSALILTAALALPVSAAAEDKGAVITTEIQPTYLVTIPADIQVAFNTEQTDFGAVTLDKAQIEPDAAVKVTLNSDNKLKHKKDATKTLAYTIYSGKAGAADTVFQNATYTTAGEKTDLTIGITKSDWAKAYAGEYSNTVTFTIEYIYPTN